MERIAVLAGSEDAQIEASVMSQSLPQKTEDYTVQSLPQKTKKYTDLIDWAVMVVFLLVFWVLMASVMPTFGKYSPIPMGIGLAYFTVQMWSPLFHPGYGWCVGAILAVLCFRVPTWLEESSKKWNSLPKSRIRRSEGSSLESSDRDIESISSSSSSSSSGSSSSSSSDDSGGDGSYAGGGASDKW